MWSDKTSTKTILELRDLFKIRTFVETGTWKGVNVEFYSHYFDEVLTCEINSDTFNKTKARLSAFENIQFMNLDSAQFLSEFKDSYLLNKCDDTIFFYLDAHFYKPGCISENRWVVNDELKALAGFKNCVICIHDFDCSSLGHLCYDGEDLNWQVISKNIQMVNSDFFYYVNSREYCDIVDLESVKELPVRFDSELVDYVQFINSSEKRRCRGILYAVPKELDLNNFKLKLFEK